MLGGWTRWIHLGTAGVQRIRGPSRPQGGRPRRSSSVPAGDGRIRGAGRSGAHDAFLLIVQRARCAFHRGHLDTVSAGAGVENDLTAALFEGLR